MSKHRDTEREGTQEAQKAQEFLCLLPLLRFLCLLCSVPVFVSVSPAAQRTNVPTAAIRLNNLGVAYINQARLAEALQAFRRSGNDTTAAQHLARFDQLTQAKIGKQISLTYGEQGPYSTAEPVGATEADPQDFSVRFAAVSLPGGRAIPATPTPPPPNRFLQA